MRRFEEDGSERFASWHALDENEPERSGRIEEERNEEESEKEGEISKKNQMSTKQ
jgi:hypothetical protein